MTYTLRINRSAEAEVTSIQRRERVLVVSRIAALVNDPRPPDVSRLSNSEKYRIRAGPYRVVYTIDDSIVTIVVVHIAHRRDR